MIGGESSWKKVCQQSHNGRQQLKQAVDDDAITNQQQERHLIAAVDDWWQKHRQQLHKAGDFKHGRQAMSKAGHLPQQPRSTTGAVKVGGGW
jgi:hypothetical protein